METKKRLPRGVRNNNPLNISLGKGTTWQGQCAKQTDGRFVQFEKLSYGLRAAFKILDLYIDAYHLDTVEKIVARWAPKNENDTAAYTHLVLKFSGLGDGEIIRPGNKYQMQRLVSAMANVENGSVPSQQQMDEGWKLYLALEEERRKRAGRAPSFTI
jgi:hypothetical protein